MPPSKEFVEAMPYTQSLLTKGLAIGYHAKAAPPTVTMPRLKVTQIIFLPKLTAQGMKHSQLSFVPLLWDISFLYKQAMLSGAVGGFLDVAFNFNTQAFLDDNLIG